MADEGVYTKNADIAALAGVDANATAVATAATDVYVLNIEATINNITRRNWSDDFAALNVDVKGTLTETGAAMCAINVVNADMDNYPTLEQAKAMINVLRDIALRNISILKNKNTQTFIDGET